MRIALAAELDTWAHKTYSTNHPEVPVERVLLKDLTAADAIGAVRKAVADEPNLVLVFGGPPCQNVSLIGTTGRKAATAKRKRFAPPTYVAFRDIVKSLRTRFFVMENVPGLFAAGDGRSREDIIEDFSDLYANKEVHVEANDHGVPQRRHRILIVGVLKGKKPGLASKALEFLAEQLQTPLKRARVVSNLRRGSVRSTRSQTCPRPGVRQAPPLWNGATFEPTRRRSEMAPT